MLFEESFTSYFPCSAGYTKPLESDIDTSQMISRIESNGTVIFVDGQTRKVYFKKNDEQIFPLDLPVHVDFELTQKCNINCKHCFIIRKRQIYSARTKKVIDRLVKEGVIIFELSGGEPLLVPEIFGIIRYLKNKKKIVTLASNGTLITKEIANRLSKTIPDKIYISLDGPKDIHGIIRGKGNFDLTLEGIRNLNNAGIYPTISFTINKLNIGHIREFIKEIEKVEIKNIFFICGEPVHNKFKENCFSHEERTLVEKELQRINTKYRYINHFAPKKINALYYGCFFRLTMCQVTPNGDVLSCPIIGEKQGYILKEDLRSIWKRMQKNMENRKSQKCKSCKWSTRCFPCIFDNRQAE